MNKTIHDLDELIQKAQHGDAGAQFTLGARYKNGDGVEQNYQEALKWYRKAAEQEYADAQVILGALHYAGQGVEQNKIMAFEWWLKAARQGNEAAKKSLDMLCTESPWACNQDK
ncbi:MAG: tetratricopeptide repeat protein [Desulfobulbaceae bacterium]|nr:tetratricopeptide repeat protein [Desulfobulbaceae bacterium]